MRYIYIEDVVKCWQPCNDDKRDNAEKENVQSSWKMEGCCRKWMDGTPVCRGLPIRLLHMGRLVTIIPILAVFGFQLSCIHF